MKISFLTAMFLLQLSLPSFSAVGTGNDCAGAVTCSSSSDVNKPCKAKISGNCGKCTQLGLGTPYDTITCVLPSESSQSISTKKPKRSAKKNN